MFSSSVVTLMWGIRRYLSLGRGTAGHSSPLMAKGHMLGWHNDLMVEIAHCNQLANWLSAMVLRNEPLLHFSHLHNRWERRSWHSRGEGRARLGRLPRSGGASWSTRWAPGRRPTWTSGTLRRQRTPRATRWGHNISSFIISLFSPPEAKYVKQGFFKL